MTLKSTFLENEVVVVHIEEGHIYHFPIELDGTVSLNGSYLEANREAEQWTRIHVLEAYKAAKAAFHHSEYISSFGKRVGASTSIGTSSGSPAAGQLSLRAAGPRQMKEDSQRALPRLANLISTEMARASIGPRHQSVFSTSSGARIAARRNARPGPH